MMVGKQFVEFFVGIDQDWMFCLGQVGVFQVFVVLFFVDVCEILFGVIVGFYVYEWIYFGQFVVDLVVGDVVWYVVEGYYVDDVCFDVGYQCYCV